MSFVCVVCSQHCFVVVCQLLGVLVQLLSWNSSFLAWAARCCSLASMVCRSLLTRCPRCLGPAGRRLSRAHCSGALVRLLLLPSVGVGLLVFLLGQSAQALPNGHATVPLSQRPRGLSSGSDALAIPVLFFFSVTSSSRSIRTSVRRRWLCATASL